MATSISAAVLVDLRPVVADYWMDQDREERGAIFRGVADAPTGARIILQVGDEAPGYLVSNYLRELRDTYNIEIHAATTRTAQRWLSELSEDVLGEAS